MPPSQVKNNLGLPPLIVAFQSQTVKRHGFYFREDLVASRIKSFAVHLGQKPFRADFVDCEFAEKSVFGDVSVFELREPIQHERRQIAGIDSNATSLRELDRIYVRNQGEHSPCSAGKKLFEIRSLHQDPGVCGVIQKFQPMRRGPFISILILWHHLV